MEAADRSFWAVMVVAALLGLAVGPAPVGPPGPAPGAVGEEAPLAIRVDVGGGTLAVLRNGEVARTFRIVADPGHDPAQPGTYRVHRVTWQPRWSPPDRPRPRRAVWGEPLRPSGRVRIHFQERGRYIHGAADHVRLSGVVGHGCVRLRQHDMVALTRFLLDEAGAASAPGLFRRVVHGATGTARVRFETPVLLTIR